ncbi:MAG: ATP phosphoribosyltransferase regulatory subunit, partial [Acidobacteriota bacterium]
MRESASLPTGVAALLFEGARRHRRLEEEMVERLEHDGFGEIILPVVDYLEPYEKMLSRASRSELYRFVDR